MGGTGPADAATESFMRYLAAEVGPRGVRVTCLWTAGVVMENDPLNAAKDMLVSMSMLRKRPTIQEFADTAAFIASDRGRGDKSGCVREFLYCRPLAQHRHRHKHVLGCVQGIVLHDDACCPQASDSDSARPDLGSQVTHERLGGRVGR